VTLIWFLLALAGTPQIKPWMLPSEPERKELTVGYLRSHRGPESLTGEVEKDVRMVPRVVVVHWTGGSTAKSAWNTFASATLGGRKYLQAAGALNVGAHFLVDRDGTIYQLLEEDRIARHCIGLNHLSIGIENVGDGSANALTVAQLQSNAYLVRELAGRHPITHVIGHHEYRQMELHPYFSELDPGYRTVKSDPGNEFMAKLRAELVGLGLEEPPEKR
jgi:N-acetylmuramoyl-L-alanine amidase